ncbi:two-component response regulator [Calothrix sp. NIES-4071]|nr:two-component response regulator [Calothrix sp. NIES-4071]BAZ56857.1 two-component response regulator [Calothrix sp. NIES-4105]
MNRILIAEDEERLAAFIEKGLRRNGFVTAVVPDGEQALQMAEQFELLLLDLGLPIKDGWVVLKELRSQGKRLPIIIVTAFNDDDNLNSAFNLGANGYVTKPFRFSDLLQKVKSHFSG